LYVTQKRVSEAEELIQKGLDLIDSKTRSFVLRNKPLLKSQFTTALAAAKWEAGEPQATEQLLREAVNLYPGNMSPYEALANLYHNQDREKEIDVLKQARTANPAAYDIRARLAALLIERNRSDEAQDLLREMADLIPTDADCEKARPYITAVKAGVPNSMEQKQLS
jgi:tetratricopeptide (TPR) repeat protein